MDTPKRYISLVMVQDTKTKAGARIPVMYDKLITDNLTDPIDGTPIYPRNVASVMFTACDTDDGKGRTLIRSIALLIKKESVYVGLIVKANDEAVYGNSLRPDGQGMISHGTMQIMETVQYDNESRYHEARFVTLSEFLGPDADGED